MSTDTSMRMRGSATPPGDEVARAPTRIELRPVAAQAFEVVEVLAVAEHEVAHPMPGGRERMSLEPGERRHAEVEPLVALRFGPGIAR